ncbi:hypothetical protein Pan44_08080 [Caulifigura coniformis]|uniref:Uncharacterized protein n=1 Tax=Caulifigura coniformis TaxID=2527983 RepID=A0A517S9M1_9PLAN|nr:hypothetical protein [Caulifigura coniformis]QDT52796.1 hypothetical protein Pan44_08080 [Caulifigura coniformis]
MSPETPSQELILAPPLELLCGPAEIMIPAAQADNPDVDWLHDRSLQIRKHHRLCLGRTLESDLHAIASGFGFCEVRPYYPRSFNKWIKTTFRGEFGLSVRTAQRYMAKYEAFVAFLKEHGHPHDAAAMQELLNSPKEFRRLCAEFFQTPNKIARRDANEWLTSATVIDAMVRILEGIECDPCSHSSPNAPRIAEVNYAKEDDGLAESTEWPGTAWVAAGHTKRSAPWCRKALSELHAGHLKAAVLCLPLNGEALPTEMFQYPIAISKAPLTVGYFEGEQIVPSVLPKHSLFVYLAEKPDVDRFSTEIRDTAVAFAPVASLPLLPATDLVTPRLSFPSAD